MKSKEVTYFTDLLHRRWLVVAIVFVIGLALTPFLSLAIPMYRGSADLLIVSEALKDTTLSEPDLPSIIASTEVLRRVISRLHLDTDPQKLAKKIKTKMPQKSSIVEITYKDFDPNQAARVANAIADETSSYYHDVATGGYTDVIGDLQRRIEQSKKTMAAADERLSHASADSGFTNSDKALDDLTTQINDLQVERGQTKASLAADRATASALTKQMNDIDPIVRGEILQKDVVYQQVQTEVGKDTADLVSERASFRDSFPGLRALATRLTSEKAEASNVRAEAISNGAGESSSYTQTVLDTERAIGVVSSDLQRLHAIETELADEQQHLRRVADAGAAVGTLRAERDAAMQQYTSLTERLGTAQGDAAQAASLGSLVVVSRAIPGPSSIFNWFLILAVVSLLVAIGVAFGVDAIDRRFWGSREIERVYGRPVLLNVGGNAA